MQSLMDLNPGFIEVELEVIPDQIPIRKADVWARNGCEWPNGIDPYPTANSEDVVEWFIRGHEYKFKGRQLSGAVLKFAQPFDYSFQQLGHGLIRLRVTDAKTEIEATDAFKVRIEARAKVMTYTIGGVDYESEEIFRRV